MARSWKALPFGNIEGMSLKAPTAQEHDKQAAPSWVIPKDIAEEVLIGRILVDAIDVEGVRIPQGRAYGLHRYPHGLAVQLPSGWTVYIEMPSQILPSSKAAAAAKQSSDWQVDNYKNPKPSAKPERPVRVAKKA